MTGAIVCEMVHLGEFNLTPINRIGKTNEMPAFPGELQTSGFRWSFSSYIDGRISGNSCPVAFFPVELESSVTGRKNLVLAILRVTVKERKGTEVVPE